MNHKDVIIVGAGLSGLTTAKKLSSEGLSVLMIDRKTLNNSTNYYSRLISTENLSEAFNISESSSFIEREIKECRGYVVRDDSNLSVSCKADDQLNKNKMYSVMWNPLIKSLLGEVEKSGVEVLLEENVESLIVTDGKVSGVRTNLGEYYSSVVVLAEGYKPILANKHGLRKGEIPPEQLLLTAEEILSVPKKTIDSTFNLKDKEGIAINLYTSFSKLNNILGIGYLYTNGNTVSIGVRVLLSDLISNDVSINDYLNEVKQNALVAPMINSGKIRTSLSYTIPAKNRVKTMSMPTLCVDGCIVVGGASTLINPLTLEQSSITSFTGLSAASAILEAIRKKDFTKESLSKYSELLLEKDNFKSSGVIESGAYVDKSDDDILNSLKSLVFRG